MFLKYTMVNKLDINMISDVNLNILYFIKLYNVDVAKIQQCPLLTQCPLLKYRKYRMVRSIRCVGITSNVSLDLFN